MAKEKSVEKKTSAASVKTSKAKTAEKSKTSTVEKKSVKSSTAKKETVEKTASKPAVKTAVKKESSASTSKKTASKKPSVESEKSTASKAKKTASRTKTGAGTVKTKKKAELSSEVDRQIEQSNLEITELLKPQVQPEQQALEDKKKAENERFKLFGKIGLAVAILLILVILLVKGCNSSGNNAEKALKQRQNTISLAKKYMDKEQYDAAMDLLNKLLIEDADDAEINELLDKLIELKKLQDQKNGQTVVVNSQPGSYDINIDTDGITNAFKSTIDSMSKELSAANEQNARNQETLSRLLEAQKAEEEERKVQVKAQEQQRKAEEEKRRAEEEELARQNKQNADKIAKINEIINQGNANLNTGKSDDAIKKYAEAVKLLPIEQGEPKFSASKYSEIASNLYDAAEREQNPGNKTILMNNAVSYAREAVAADPSNAKAHFILAMNAESAKDSLQAEKELELAVKYDPNNYLYYYYLGRRQQINKKFSQARASYTSSIKLNSNFESSHFNLGITCIRLDLPKEALSSFRKAYSVNPQHAKAYLEEARLLARYFKDADGAINAYNKVLAIEPDNVSALKECGSVYAEKGDYAKAENNFRRVVAKLGTSPDPMTYYNLSTVLYNQNKVDEAVKYALEAYNTKDYLRTSNEKAMVTYNYALITEKSGNTTKAIPLYIEAIKFNPSHTKAKINLGIMYMEMNPPDVDTALSFLEGAYAEDKNNFEVNNNLGNAYLQKKDFTNAINYYLNATKIKPKDSGVKTNLAKAYAEAGQFDNAKVTYIEVINQKPDSWECYIELAKVCIALKDTYSAEGYLTALQNKKPEYRTSEVRALLETVKN